MHVTNSLTNDGNIKDYVGGNGISDKFRLLHALLKSAKRVVLLCPPRDPPEIVRCSHPPPLQSQPGELAQSILQHLGSISVAHRSNANCLNLDGNPLDFNQTRLCLKRTRVPQFHG